MQQNDNVCSNDIPACKKHMHAEYEYVQTPNVCAYILFIWQVQMKMRINISIGKIKQENIKTDITN